MARAKRRLVFDIETEQFSDAFRDAETDKERRKHAPKLRVACVFDETENAYRYYTAGTASQLIKDLQSADEIITFNGKSFDLFVLQRHHRLSSSQSMPRKGMHVDIHEIMSAEAGFRVSLNSAVQINFGEKKHTAGRAMAALSLDQLKVACRSDVSQTYRLWQAHVEGTLQLPPRKYTGQHLEDDPRGPYPGHHMPDICSTCHDVGSLVFHAADEKEMTEGQLAEYLAGTWGFAICTTCGHYDFWEMM